MTYDDQTSWLIEFSFKDELEKIASRNPVSATRRLLAGPKPTAKAPASLPATLLDEALDTRKAYREGGILSVFRDQRGKAKARQMAKKLEEEYAKRLADADLATKAALLGGTGLLGLSAIGAAGALK